MGGASAREKRQKDGDESISAAVAEFGIRKFKVKKSEALWLMSFSDLSMILLSFFIMLLAISKPDVKKAEVVQQAIQPKVPVRKDSLHAVTESLLGEIKRLRLEESVNVRLDIEGLAIEFKDNLLFDSGSAKLRGDTAAPMGKVMQVIAHAAGRYHLVIEGHTDDVPLKRGSPFPSNWELSSARGIALLRQFEQKGVKDGFVSVESFAHTRPKVKFAGLKGRALEEARTANRRVVIRIR